MKSMFCFQNGATIEERFFVSRARAYAKGHRGRANIYARASLMIVTLGDGSGGVQTRAST